MLLTKLSNFVSRIFIITIYFCLLFSNLNAEESIDIWKKQKSTITKKNDIEDKKESPKINILEKTNSNQKITIIEEKQTEPDQVRLLGLHDLSLIHI